MKKVERFVIWICSKFTRSEIERIIQGLSEVLANRNPDVKPRDDFKEKHPNYRNFFVDPEPPLTTSPKPTPKLNWKELLAKYQDQNGRPLKLVNPRNPRTKVPKDSILVEYALLLRNIFTTTMHKKRSQIKCKICGCLSRVHPRHQLNSKYWCPHCNHALYLWKERPDVSIYKCDNDRCPLFLKNKSRLNFRERLLVKIKSSQFKLRYQYREYHFTNEQLTHSAPEKGLLYL